MRVVFIYLLLASQYESFFDPLSIMLSLPLLLVGAVLGLLVFSNSLSIQSFIGIVMLMGLVTKNGILIVDFTDILRRQGVPRTKALIDAGRLRMRPILMTSAAIIFAMIPLVLELEAGSESRAPMAAVFGAIDISRRAAKPLPLVPE